MRRIRSPRHGPPGGADTADRHRRQGAPGEAWLTISEGRHHQVKKMIAALGGQVTALHREAIGGLELPADLVAGAMRPITDDELARLGVKTIVSVDGAKFWVATGQGFQFQAYFNTVLTKTAQDFYRIPAWLQTHGCAFLDRYALWPAKPI